MTFGARKAMTIGSEWKAGFRPEINMAFAAHHVRVGSFAPVSRCPGCDRFTPNSGHDAAVPRMTRSANRRHPPPNLGRHSGDHFNGTYVPVDKLSTASSCPQHQAVHSINRRHPHPNPGCPTGSHLNGTYVRVEEPSTAPEPRTALKAMDGRCGRPRSASCGKPQSPSKTGAESRIVYTR
jgi:hypothetical protein